MNLIVQRGKPYEYRDEETGERYFSVTQVRKVMWDGMDRIPYAVLEKARERGERLHTYFALLMGSMAKVCPEPEPLPDLSGYCRAIQQWALDVVPLPLLIEDPSVCRKLGIAGTSDLLADLLANRGQYIIDLKTGEPTPTDPVQLLAYREMEGYQKVKGLFDLYVHADGTYDFKEVKPNLHQADWACFLNALQVLKWRTNK